MISTAKFDRQSQNTYGKTCKLVPELWSAYLNKLSYELKLATVQLQMSVKQTSSFFACEVALEHILCAVCI